LQSLQKISDCGLQLKFAAGRGHAASYQFLTMFFYAALRGTP
jgi:hypothetical protein